ARDDVVALVFVELVDAFEREVVALGRAAREDDLFFALRADELGDALARVVDRFFGDPAEVVAARGGVAELLGEERNHLLEHARVDRRRRVVVHEDGKLDAHHIAFCTRKPETSSGTTLSSHGWWLHARHVERSRSGSQTSHVSRYWRLRSSSPSRSRRRRRCARVSSSFFL